MQFILDAQNSILLKTIPVDDQLPSSSVPRIFQDKEGFLWFGTLDGLCRYDGYGLLTFRSDSKMPDLLVDNEITCLAEDSVGNLWIGTKKGVNILNKTTFKITFLDKEELNGRNIKSIFVASDQTVWVGMANGLFRYNPDFSFYKKYRNLGINAIYEDKENNLWIMAWESGLYLFDPLKDDFEKLPPIGSYDNPFRMYQDNRGNKWIGTWGDGMFRFKYDPEKKNVEYIPHKIENEEFNRNENHFFGIIQDDKFGYLWLLSSSGLYALKYISEDNDQIEEVNVSYLFTESNNIFSDIIKDRKGNLWIGTFSEGVFSINFDQPLIKNYPIPSIKKQVGFTTRITALYEDSEGNIWINQDRKGLGVYSPEKDYVTFFQEYPALWDIHSFISTTCFWESPSNPGNIWVGSEYSPIIYCLKKTDNDLIITEQYDLSLFIADPGNPRKFYGDGKGNLWIITNKGLLVKPNNKDLIIPENFSFGEITDITEDTGGDIWISTRNSGIYKIQVQENFEDKPLIINYTKSNSVLKNNNGEAIHMDANNIIWIGTKEGSVFLYDIIKEEVKDITSSFSMINEGIFNIISDNYGHIWISTSKRIVEFNPNNNVIKEYSVTDANILVGSFVANSFCINKKGEILYGGNKGISVFTPFEELSGQPEASKVYIADVKINNQSILSGNKNNQLDLSKLYLTIDPDDRNIEIDFSSLDYNDTHKIRYAYKLEGVDDDWVYTSGDRQFAVYNQLKKGNYVFNIKVMDENGFWSNQVTKLNIYKRPAFYETWWAYVIYVLLLLFAVRLIYKFGKNRLELENNLKITQIEKEKTEELTQIKLKYFTNISHDFLTPLTILSCLIDDAEMSYKGKIVQFDSMRSNINRLKRLLQQVLDFRKIESGKMKLKISNGDIASFIREVCYTNFTPLMKKKNIEFSFSSNPLHIQAWFDVDKIDKIIFNLLSNAFKYTPENGKVEVSLDSYELKGNSHLLIKVQDSGIGISKEDIDKIFTPFYSDNKITEAGNSNGIGLNLTKDLIELHHGTIKVESEPDKGSLFLVDIPIDKECYSSKELDNNVVSYDSYNDMLYSKSSVPEIVSDNLAEKSTDGQKNIRILLVDDNEELLYLMRNILSKKYAVLIAKNGLEALSLINGNEIDIIISDVMMPEMDGLQLCRKLKANIETSHIPVILLTAKNSMEDRIECYNAGANGYISKPFDLKVLEARISNFVSNRIIKQNEFQANKEINITTLEYPSKEEEFLNKAIKVIEKFLSNSEFDVSVLSEELGLSKSTLYRKIKTMTGLSPIEFIRNIRLKHACQILKSQSMPIAEVAYTVGFSDPNYFAQCFKSEFSITPKDYRKTNQAS